MTEIESSNKTRPLCWCSNTMEDLSTLSECCEIAAAPGSGFSARRRILAAYLRTYRSPADHQVLKCCILACLSIAQVLKYCIDDLAPQVLLPDVPISRGCPAGIC